MIVIIEMVGDGSSSDVDEGIILSILYQLYVISSTNTVSSCRRIIIRHV